MNYSKEFKEEALKLSDEIGVKKAAAQLGLKYYTPKHGSWLDIAEIEFSALGRQCIANSRIPDLPTLRALLVPWATSRNELQKGVDWHFTTDDARIKLNICILLLRFRVYRVLVLFNYSRLIIF